jgi:hypothetical protein
MLVMFGRRGPMWERTTWVGRESFEWHTTRASGVYVTARARGEQHLNTDIGPNVRTLTSL